jgi:hypothetical protein
MKPPLDPHTLKGWSPLSSQVEPPFLELTAEIRNVISEYAFTLGIISAHDTPVRKGPKTCLLTRYHIDLGAR